jgi:DNA (cytosine-5)-methyltransferase 1
LNDGTFLFKILEVGKKKYLNLYAGLGGNIELVNEDDYDITNIELEPSIAEKLQLRKPNQKVIIADAHQYLLEHGDEYDFIWSSPPCQTHSRMMKATRHKKKRFSDMSLYQEIIFLTHFYTGNWVVENVKPFYEPLIQPKVILGRHYFWSNFFIPQFEPPEQPKGFITSGTVAETDNLKKWLGINYEGNLYYKDNHCPGQVLRNCVHPEIGLSILQSAEGKILNKKPLK